jgi:hypothetical protein
MEVDLGLVNELRERLVPMETADWAKKGATSEIGSIAATLAQLLETMKNPTTPELQRNEPDFKSSFRYNSLDFFWRNQTIDSI